MCIFLDAFTSLLLYRRVTLFYIGENYMMPMNLRKGKNYFFNVLLYGVAPKPTTTKNKIKKQIKITL